MHAFMTNCSYWARGRSLDTTTTAIAGSARVVGLYRDGAQVGFARAVSDGATYAYLADVYVLSDHRGHGLGLELVREIVDRGPLRGLRWALNTADAQELYAKLGFSSNAPAYPAMERPRRPHARASG
ncbi:MAG TPA: GNAT family N-acetyltransferase [Solirubrobacteraceae bacterium]|nr:GNAT family N-acetyltransferase [Solirubrobacteraceae bacterium]